MDFKSGRVANLNEFGQKVKKADEDFMIHILNNLPQDFNVILDGLENCLMVTMNNVLTINMIHEKSNHRYKKLKTKKKKRVKKKRS